MQTKRSTLIVEDFAHKKPKDANVPNDKEILSCNDCLAFILANNTNTTPVTVSFEDPDAQPVVCESTEEAPVIQPLQMFENESLLAQSIQAAKKAGALKIVVLTPEENELDSYNKLITEEALAAGAHTCIAYSAADEEKMRKASNNYEVFGVSRYVLSLLQNELANYNKTAANEGKCTAKHVLLLNAAQPRIAAIHLKQLRYRLEKQPTANIVTSWIIWLRRLPLLFNGEWLATCHKAKPGIQNLTVSEVVFGEEKIAPTQAWPTAYNNFFADCKLSALEAVRLAKKLEALPKSATEERDTLVANLTDSDKTLLGLAQETHAFAKKDAKTPFNALVKGSFTKDLVWADSFGKQNKLAFPIFTDRKQRGSLVYLDTAATAQRLGTVEDALINFDKHENANVYRGGYELSMQATFTLNDARATLENFIGANRRETVYTANTTGGCNLIAQAWGTHNIHKGDTIVVCLCDHHSNMLPWMMLAEQKQARVAFIPLASDGSLDQNAYKEALVLHPKLVCIPQISNVIGLLNPVEKMAQAAKKAGARVFIDGAQSLPHIKVNVYDLGCDFFAFSGHKLYGPMGIGGVWINPEAYAEMEPVTSGGGAISHVSTGSYYLRLGAIAYELGTPAVSQAIGLAAAVDYLDAIGMENVERHSAVLTEYLMRGLSHIDGITVFGDHHKPAGQTGLVSLDVYGLQPAEIGTICGNVGVALRSGGHCALPLSASLGIVGSARISLGIYNTVEDIEAALVALRLCRKLYA